MENLIHLTRLLSGLKNVSRDGWNALGRTVAGAESTADHSFGAAMLAFFVARSLSSRKLDLEKLLLLCLVHDLVEAKPYTGDITLFRAEAGEARAALKAEIKKKELRAIEEIRSDLGPGVGDEVYDLWMEFEEGATPEAIVANDLDNIEAALQAHWYFEQGHKVDPHEFFVSARAAVKTEELVHFLDETLLPKLPSSELVKKRMA